MLDLIGLIGMTALGAMLLLGIAAWRFPNLVGGIAGMAQSKLPAYGGGIQFTATLVVFLALVIFGWLITKDRLFQES